MQILILSLVIGIFLHDAAVDASGPITWLELSPTAMLALWILPKLLVGGMLHGLCIFARRRMSRAASSHRELRRVHRFLVVMPWSLLILYATDLGVGTLQVIRERVVDTVLLDELLVMAPTLGTLIWSWWAYYPIDRRTRESTVLSRMDKGLPVYPIWTREQFLLSRIRHDLVILLLPLLVLLALKELVLLLPPVTIRDTTYQVQGPAMLLGTLAVFLLMPLVLRALWDTAPLPAGSMRDRLLELCRSQGVRIRELLLWRTFGGMVNGAVMGLLPRLRFILLTDALLDMMPQRQVEAVMAHELAHVRRHHIGWLLAIAMALFGATNLLCLAGAAVLYHRELTVLADSQRLIWTIERVPWVSIGAGVAAAVVWFLGFGWVSRRFELQADAFAAQHLSTHPAAPGGDASVTGATGTVQSDAAATMITALQQVAELNQIPVGRRSWRHGSIKWRQDHLRSIIGRKLDDLPIDQRVIWIKLVGGVLFTAVMGLYIWASRHVVI